MSDANEPRDKRDAPEASPPSRRSRFEEDVPSAHILKLALIAAAIIVVIALILYFKARTEPPALHDELQAPTVQMQAHFTIKDGKPNF